MGKLQMLYLPTRCRSKLGWFFWFGPIHVTICRNLAIHKLWITQHHRTTQPGDVYTGTSPTRWPATSPCSSTTPRRPASLSVDSRGPPRRPDASPGTTRCRRNWDGFEFDEFVSIQQRFSYTQRKWELTHTRFSCPLFRHSCLFHKNKFSRKMGST